MTAGGYTNEGTADLKPLPRFIGGERQSFCQAFFKKRLSLKRKKVNFKKGVEFFCAICYNA
jgi:hypothetical protein